MPTCPTCLVAFASEVTHCPEHGQQLLPDETLAHVDRELGPGDTVGEYQIEGKLGEGGFGSVYSAVHPLIGKNAAIKVLSREFSANPQMVSRFVAEARAVNQIRHRNIVDIFSFGALPDGRQYYVMERLDGQPFDKFLSSRGRLPPAEAISILRGVARALDAAHGRGILHRDLKPENVFLAFDEDGRPLPKLLDFGLVKQMGESSSGHKTKTGAPMGTPYYMSPEQCRGVNVDARTDVYSFGVMVFEVLVGRLPFSGESPMDVILQHMTATAPAPSSIVPELPPAIDGPILRMMSKDPAERPGTVGAALDEIASAAGVAPDASRSGAASGPVLPQSAPVDAVGKTMVDPTSGIGAAVTAPSQTFLGAESDVVPTSGRKTGLVVGVAAVALLLGAVGVGVTFLRRGADTAGATPPAAPTGVASLAVTAPEPPPPASTVAPPPAATSFVLRVEGAPPGAQVFLDDTALGAAPGPFSLDAGAQGKLSVRAKGFKPVEVPVHATADLTVPVSLDKIAPAAGGKPTGGKKPVHSDIPGFDDK